MIRLLAVIVLILPACFGQASTSPEAEADSRASVPVTLNGREILRVTALASFSAAQRAQAISDRLAAAASDIATPADALQVKESEVGSTILAGDRVIMVVTDHEARVEGVPRRALADNYKTKFAEEIALFRNDRRPRLLFLATLYALGVSMAFVAFLIYGNRFYERAYRFIERSFHRKVRHHPSAPLLKVQSERLWTPISTLLRIGRTVIFLPVCFLFVGFILGLYPWTRPVARDLLELILNPLRILGKSFVESLPNLLFLLVFVLIVRFALKLIKLMFEIINNGAITFSGFEAEWAMPTYRIVRVVVIAFALVVAYPYVPGSDSGAFKGVSLFIGVVFSLSSSSAIGNMIAGYVLTYRRAYRVGDRVKIGNSVGDVEEIRVQSTFVRSIKNEIFVIPNSEVLNTSVVNYSTLAKRDGLILHISVGIGYETPWRLVEAMLLEAARRTPEVLSEPAPFILQTALGDFAITYEINAYCDKPRSSELIYTALQRNILDVFNEQEIQIMTPAYFADPAEPKLVPADKEFPGKLRPAVPRNTPPAGN